MAPTRRTTRATPATTTTTTTLMTDKQLRTLIAQGVADVLAERDAARSRNGEDSHDSGTGIRRQAPLALETVGHDVAYAMTWTDMKKKMTNKYCPRDEIKMFPEETDKIEKYVSGLPDMIHGRSGEKKPYGGSKPLRSKRNYHHDGPCAPKCHKCNRVGHLARDYRSTANANTANNQRGIGAGQKATCYECNAQGNFKRECPKLKNNNHGNQGGNANAPAKVYVVGHAGTNPDSNIITGTFLLNNRYAYILFNTGADRSFVLTVFRSQINITPTALDHYYDVELADGKIIGLNTLIQGCTLNLLKHLFNIDLMPVELGSLDVIIGMD
ncbi:reverse transcriptase domain-containing protein [Tanacetum coccineum]